MPNLVQRLKGVICPVATPLRSDETLDSAGLRRLLQFLREGGVHGVFVLGTTGELATLLDSVRRQVVEVTLDEVGGRLPVLAGVGEAGTGRAVQLAREWRRLGVDGLVACSPYYFQYNSQEELIHHFTRIAEAVDLPLILYNIPQTTHRMIEFDTVVKLRECRNIIGIKDSSGDFTYFQRLLMRFRHDPSFLVFQGAELLSGVSVLYGADGIVPGLGNVAPGLAVQLYAAASSGDVETVFRLQERFNNLARIYQYGSWLAGLKAALEVLGICGGQVSSPLAPVDFEQVRRVLAENGYCVPLYGSEKPDPRPGAYP